MHIAIVLNGDPPTPSELELLDDADAIVCADGGANAVFTSARTPTVIVGDLDSLDPTLAERAAKEGVEVQRHASEKDFTDGELAVEAAIARGAREVTLLGGHGLRMAMFLGNLALLRRLHDEGIEARMIGHGEVHWFVGEGRERVLEGHEGHTVNVLPVGGPAVVTIEGTGYDVDKVELAPTAARGVSNHIEADPARVHVQAGTVLVVLETFEAE